MGLAKRQLEHDEACGFSYHGNKSVCPNCFTDYAVKQFISQNAVEKRCDFCGASGKKPIAAPMEDVIETIVGGIRTEYGNPDDCMGWDSEEDSWWGATVWNTYELLTEEIGLDTSEEILTVISDAISSIQDQWCENDPYGLRDHEILLNSWQKFVFHVTHRTRYFFSNPKTNPKPTARDETIAPSRMLRTLATTIESLDLIKKLPKCSLFYRVRIHDPTNWYCTADQLASPLAKDAKYSNRMSPAGIPMFYASFDEITAMAEVFDRQNNDAQIASIAIFKSVRPLRVLDLTILPDEISLFDSGRRSLRANLRFLRSFVSDVSKPINKDGFEHMEYIPTQVFTEYFRRIYKLPTGKRINGIIYSSGRVDGGKSCVLFLLNQQCFDLYSYDKAKSNQFLYMENVIRFPLILDKKKS